MKDSKIEELPDLEDEKDIQDTIQANDGEVVERVLESTIKKLNEVIRKYGERLDKLETEVEVHCRKMVNYDQEKLESQPEKQCHKGCECKCGNRPHLEDCHVLHCTCPKDPSPKKEECRHQWTHCLVDHPIDYHCPSKCLKCGKTTKEV